ncbi:MAG: hypothetical protein IPO36_18750 [Anaerolineales bacterium]|nr:hypothetical protein [Anaerolineales bacterium]
MIATLLRRLAIMKRLLIHQRGLPVPGEPVTPIKCALPVRKQFDQRGAAFQRVILHLGQQAGECRRSPLRTA